MELGFVVKGKTRDYITLVIAEISAGFSDGKEKRL
jgi:hypothetical protein